MSVQLSPAGQQLVQSLSARYGVSPGAVEHMLTAVFLGNGSMAQFSHPEFGGSGQWMRGGMTMVGDMFNNQLKYLVENICNDISNALASHQTAPFAGSFQSQSQSGQNAQAQAAGAFASANSLFVPDPTQQWWPSELGTPTAVGSQNNMRYAYFANSHRLAVTTGGQPWVYDTLNHQIGGFSQQQGGGTSITFTSQMGTVDLSSLPVLWRNGSPVAPAATQWSPAAAPPSPMPIPAAPAIEQPGATPAPSSAGDLISMLERLGQLKEKGYISDDEFNAKKAEILKRL